MQYVQTTISLSDGCAWLTVYETHNPRETLLQLLRQVAQEWYCRHDCPRPRCLLAPPTWTYVITGGHYRWSLGGQLWRLGQTIERDHGSEIYRRKVTQRELVEHFGWSRSDVFGGT